MGDSTTADANAGAISFPVASGASRGEMTATHWGALLVLLTVLAYGPAFVAGFIWVDDDYVLENYNLRSTAGLVKIWRQPRSSPQYYPLVHTSYWLEHRLWDLWPVGYHATNIFLHATSALLLWRVLLLIELPAAWLAAAVFALHPVHVESVAWITERKNTLSLLFYLAAAFCFLKRELAPQSRGSWGLYLASVACFLAALLCKTVVATLPCALLVVLWWKHGTLSPRQVALAALLLLLAVPLAMHTAYLERHHVGAMGPEWEFSFADRCLIAGRAVWFYACKLMVPYPLTFMYPRWEIDDHDWRQYLFPLAACLLVAALWLFRGRIGRGPLAAALFFGGTLFPALGFFNVYPMKYSFVADHFQYVASLGPIALFVAAGAQAAERCHLTTAGQLLACGLLAVLAVLTWLQSTIYRNQETLWRDTLAKNPQAEMAYINLGNFLRSEGRLPEALEAFDGAVKLRPGEPDGHIGLAMTYAAVPDLDRAEQILQEALTIDPNYALTYGNLADVRFRQGEPQEAVRLYRQALALDQENVLIRFNYGTLLFKQRKLDEAQRQYEQILVRSPDSVAVRYALAILHLVRGKQAAAAAQLRAVLEIDPKYADARELLAEAESGARRRTTPQFDPAK